MPSERKRELIEKTTTRLAEYLVVDDEGGVKANGKSRFGMKMVSLAPGHSRLIGEAPESRRFSKIYSNDGKNCYLPRKS
jgi:hypothetical protein